MPIQGNVKINVDGKITNVGVMEITGKRKKSVENFTQKSRQVGFGTASGIHD